MTYLTSILLIGGEPPTIRTHVQRTTVRSYDPQTRALGAVSLGDLTVQTSGDPQSMRDIAAAFLTCADLMDEENARIAGERSIGGRVCSCGAVPELFTDEDATRWDEEHAACGDPGVLAKRREIADIAARRPDVVRGGAA